MTFQEQDHPRADSGKFENKAQSEAAGVSLSAASGTKPKPIMAEVTLQKWNDNDENEEVGTVVFDAAPILAGIYPGLSPAQREDLDPSICDQIFEEAMSRGLAPRHDGPFDLGVQNALDEALEENPGYFDSPYPHEKTVRHLDVALESPLSPYELGARIDENNRVQALAVLELSEMLDNSSDENWDAISTTVVGNDMLRDMFPTPVSINSENQVVYRIEGDASEVINEMSDDDLKLFEEGRTAAMQ